MKNVTYRQFQLLVLIFLIITSGSLFVFANETYECSRCKFVNSSDAVYCIKCGTRLISVVSEQKKPIGWYKKYGLGIIELSQCAGRNEKFTSQTAVGVSFLSIRYISNSGWGIEFHPLSLYSYSGYITLQESTKGSIIIKDTDNLRSDYYLTTLLKYYFLRYRLVSIYIGGGVSLQHGNYSHIINYYDLQGNLIYWDYDWEASKYWWQFPAPVANLGFELLSSGVFHIDINAKYFWGESMKSYKTDMVAISGGINMNW